MTTKTIILQESSEGHFRAEIDEKEVRLITHIIRGGAALPGLEGGVGDLRFNPLYPKFTESVVAYIPVEQWLEITKEVELLG